MMLGWLRGFPHPPCFQVEKFIVPSTKTDLISKRGHYYFDKNQGLQLGQDDWGAVSLRLRWVHLCGGTKPKKDGVTRL